MKRVFVLIISVMVCLTFIGCGNNGNTADNSSNKTVNSGAEINSQNSSDSQSVEPADSENSSEPSDSDSADITNNPTISESTPEVPSNSEKSNILVAYFSLADEQYEVGVIEKGNTHK